MPDELKKSTNVFLFNHNSWWVRDALVFRMKNISDDLLGQLAISAKESVSCLQPYKSERSVVRTVLMALR